MWLDLIFFTFIEGAPCLGSQAGFPEEEGDELKKNLHG